MRVISVFLLMFFFVFIQIAKSQVSLNLHIDYFDERNVFIFNKDTSEYIKVPYLTFTYKNNGDNDVYFVDKIGGNLYPDVDDNGILYNPCPSEIEKYEYALSRKYSFYDYLKIKYEVSINDEHFYFGDVLWLIKRVSKKNQDQDVFSFNNEINDLYDLLSLQEEVNRIDTMCQIPGFKYSERKTISFSEALNLINKNQHNSNKFDIDNDPFESKLMQKCVFLKRGEELSGRISLIGFNILGGEYSFCIDDKPIKYIYKTFVREKKTPLPESLNGFTLYKNKFISNKCVTIKVKR